MSELNDKIECINKCISKNTFEIILVTSVEIFEFKRRELEYFDVYDSTTNGIESFKPLNLSCLNTEQYEKIELAYDDVANAIESGQTFIINRREGLVRDTSEVRRYLNIYDRWPVTVLWTTLKHRTKHEFDEYQISDIIYNVIRHMYKEKCHLYIINGMLFKLEDNRILMESNTFSMLKHCVDCLNERTIEGESNDSQLTVYHARQLLKCRFNKLNPVVNDSEVFEEELRKELHELKRGFAIYIDLSGNVHTLKNTMMYTDDLEYIHL